MTSITPSSWKCPEGRTENARNAILRRNQSHGHSTVIDLKGDIDRNAKDGAGGRLQAEAARRGPVILNFTEVDYINSTGIAVIVALLAHARTDGRPLRACGLSAHYHEIFQITRLADFMSIYDDELAALAVECPRLTRGTMPEAKIAMSVREPARDQGDRHQRRTDRLL